MPDAGEPVPFFLTFDLLPVVHHVVASLDGDRAEHVWCRRTNLGVDATRHIGDGEARASPREDRMNHDLEEQSPSWVLEVVVGTGLDWLLTARRGEQGLNRLGHLVRLFEQVGASEE